MVGETNAIELLLIRSVFGELWVGCITAFLVRFLPYKEAFVDGSIGVGLELLVGILSSDEDFDVVVVVNRIVTVFVLRVDIGLLQPESDVEKLVIPQDG